MKERIHDFISGLIPYDYILFGSVLLLFLLFIILAILLRNHLKTALFFVLLGFGTFLLGPTVGYLEMHNYLFQNKIELLEQKHLHFTNAVVVKGKISNISHFNFHECRISAGAYKVTKNRYKNYIYKLKPFVKMSIIKRDIPKGTTKVFKIIIEPFNYQKDYNISLKASCK